MPTRSTEAAGGSLGRRRFIAIAAAFAGAGLAPGGAKAAGELHHWNGVALGATASIQLLHPDPAEARRIIDAAVLEIERLEAIFSLYRADSAVTALNRTGRLAAPPLELVELLALAREVSRASGGAFDVTVQPLWLRYRDHFAAAGEAPGAPDVSDLLPLVDWRGVGLEAGLIELGRPGMAITLNGIAQGYVTDRVAELLRRNGVDDVLLDLGEARGLGQGPDGRPWRIGIADPADPARVLARLDGSGSAVATSGGYGSVFDHDRRFGHLIDPRDGRTAPVLRGTTVVAGDAALADAWSTAFALMGVDEVRSVASAIGGLGVYLSTSGEVTRLV